MQSDPTLLYVHGTGVRESSHEATVAEIRSKINELELPCQFKHCLWGDIGIHFDGLSLPDPPAPTTEQQAQAQRWEYLQIDPLFDLKLWCLPSARGVVVGAGSLWNSVSVYQPSTVLSTLLQQEQCEHLFAPAWTKIVANEIPQQAFDGAGDEQPQVARTFAEAVVAQMMRDGAERNPPLPVPLPVAEAIVERLIYDWKQEEKGLFGDVFDRVAGWLTKTAVRPARGRYSRAFAPALGDVLLYEARGDDIRAAIRKEIAAIPGHVFVLSHSLGGVACFELMIQGGLPNVRGLITAGSQAPLLHEFGALKTLAQSAAFPAKLPQHFPPWLNICDENDLLSYCANRIFGCEVDQFVNSMLPPIAAHSAYWKMDRTWELLRAFIKRWR
jgi:hypothetical protein